MLLRHLIRRSSHTKYVYRYLCECVCVFFIPKRLGNVITHHRMHVHSVCGTPVYTQYCIPTKYQPLLFIYPVIFSRSTKEIVSRGFRVAGGVATFCFFELSYCLYSSLPGVLCVDAVVESPIILGLIGVLVTGIPIPSNSFCTLSKDCFIELVILLISWCTL